MSRRSLWTVVKQLNADRRLALFVGAGVSMACGLPSWEQCVARVLAGTWKDDADIIQTLLQRRKELAIRYARNKAVARFNRIVHDVLYEGNVHISTCVAAIAKSGIRHICNFNFDDLIAEALLTKGVDCQIVAPGERCNSAEPGVIVYHPHGILPRSYSGAEIDAAKIVFSEDDYHRLYSDPNSWANVCQLSLLTTKSVLFIGLSMNDPNLRRLIDLARNSGFTNQHIAVFRDPLFASPKAERPKYKQLRDMIELDMKSLGITTWFVDSYDKITEILEGCAVRVPRPLERRR